VPATLFKPKSPYASAVREIVGEVLKDEQPATERTKSRFSLLKVGR
jgi:hypothetical protein